MMGGAMWGAAKGAGMTQTEQGARDPHGALATPLALAIDAGTSSTRAMIFDRHGVAVPGLIAQTPVELTMTADGGVEGDADTLVAVVVAVIDKVLALAGPLAAEIGAVGTSCFWHSMLGVDAAGRAATPVYTWADDRSAAAVDALRGELDERAMHDRTGCVIHTSYWPAKLRWLRDTQPQLWAAAGTHWLGYGEYLLARFTGSAACSIAMASGTGLLDQNRADWDAPLLAHLGLDRARLPQLIDRDEALPALLPEWAKRWPALAGAKWFPSVGDGACNNVGSGCVTPARIALSVGTSGVMRVVVKAERLAIPPQVWCYRLDRQRFILGGALSNGGVVADWLRGNLHLPPDAAARVAALPPDTHGLTILPFWAGQRTPDWDPRATAAILGLTLDTDALAILRAGLEAVGLRFALVHELLEPLAASDYQIIISGGALGHWPIWPQIIADALGHPLVASAEPEASARGAALLALAGLGTLPDLEVVPVALAQEYTPDPEAHAIYARARVRLERTHDAIRAALPQH
jgi:gluconokinase